MAYGVGVFAQGGMGTEYGGTSFLAAGSGETVRSEVSVGRLLLPFAYNVSPRLALGATADFVWAGMDLRMALSGAQFADLATPGQQVFGEASGTLVNTFGGFIGQGLGVNHARFDFSNDSDFTGEAMGYGGAVKLGAVYRVREDLTLGAAFHSKTALGDLETDDAGVAMNVNATAFGMPASVPMELVGKISVRDFEWPHTAALGAAWQATDALLLAADYKWIGWSGVMKDFKMTFTASDAASNDFTAAFGPGADLRGQSMDAVLYQEWEDEHVLMLGGAYTISRPLTVRAGVNVATNPIPDEYVNPLFPAIVTNHVTLGAGWAFSEKGSVDLSLTVAPKSTATNPGFAAGGDEVEISHSQTNAQIMYSRRF
jgi:long-chain fatty acid transport protein